MLDRKILDRWLEKYNALEKKSDKYLERQREYESRGENRKAARAEAASDEIDAKCEGMVKALNIFGYTTVYQNGELKVVELN